MKHITAIAVGLTIIVTNTAYADVFGNLGLSYSNHSGENSFEGLRETSHGLTLDGSLAWSFGDRHTLIMDALYRKDNYSESIAFGDRMGAQKQIGLHYQYDMTDNLIIGGFGGYGEAPHTNEEEDYSVTLAGIEAIYNAPRNVTLFAQIGAVDSPGGENLSSFGYSNGEIYRVGIAYTGLERTTVIFDLEKGSSESYEDANEPGDYLTASLSAETVLRQNQDWSVSYGVRFGRFDAVGDQDSIRETSVTIGARYNFGNKNRGGDRVRDGLIGLPYTPLRASAWTPAMD